MVSPCSGHWSPQLCPRRCALYDWAPPGTGDISPGRPGDPRLATVDNTGQPGAQSSAQGRQSVVSVTRRTRHTCITHHHEVISCICFAARIKTLYAGCVSKMASLKERPCLTFHDPARLTGALDVGLWDVITGRQNLLMAINNHQITSIAHILASSAHNAHNVTTRRMLWPMLWWGQSLLSPHPAQWGVSAKYRGTVGC